MLFNMLSCVEHIKGMPCTQIRLIKEEHFEQQQHARQQLCHVAA